jgi:chromosome segregation ATPase
MDNENQENQVPENNISAPDELAAIKAQLAEEKTARAAVEEAVATKDTRIAELEAQVAEFSGHLENKTKELEAAAAELATVKEARGEAVTKYLGVAKALNPTIPEGIIAGETIAEIEQSVEKGKAIVAAVRKAMEAEAAAAKVPAGAPTRGEISLEGLSPREKIAAGIRPTGGS